MPQSRDRHPRLETPPSLPQGEERLTVTYLNGSFYPKGCHKVGTDALVCPPERNQRKPPQAPQKEKMLPDGMTHRGKWADRRGRLSLHCCTLLHRTNNSFTCQPVHSSTLPNHNFELHVGVRFCGISCSFRNSVSPCGFVPSVDSVLKMPQQRTY